MQIYKVLYFTVTIELGLGICCTGSYFEFRCQLEFSNTLKLNYALNLIFLKVIKEVKSLETLLHAHKSHITAGPNSASHARRVFVTGLE